MTATATVTPTRRAGRYRVWLGLAGALTVGGLVGWIIQVVSGMVVTDMRNSTTWGLYIVGFMFFVGLSAGGLIISSAGKVFRIAAFEPIARVATFLSLVCILAAAIFVVPDVGRPDRLWKIAAHPNISSPLIWDVAIIATYAALSAFYLLTMIRAERDGQQGHRLRVVAFVALPTAILVHSVTAWIFGLQISRPFWNSALLAPMFISSALVSGTALLVGVLLWLRRVGSIEFDGSFLQRLSGLLAVFLFIDLFLLASELITLAYPQTPEGDEPLRLLLTDAGAPMFWAEVILGGALALFLLLHRRTRQHGGWVGLAAALIVIGIFFKRFNLLMAGFLVPLIENPAVTTGPASPNEGTLLQNIESGLGYFPSLIEWGVFAGVVGLAILVFTLGVRYLPLGLDRRPRTHGDIGQSREAMATPGPDTLDHS